MVLTRKTHRGHGDDGPPVGVEHGVELGALVGGVLLDGEGERGEDEDAHRHEEQEQSQLLVAVLYGETEALEADRVAGQLEDPAIIIRRKLESCYSRNRIL